MRLRKPRILLPVLSVILTLLAFGVYAYDEPEFPPLDLQLYNPDTVLSAENIDDNKNAMIKAYYDYCVRSNESPEFDKYMVEQCACTGAEMTNIMSTEQVRAMYDDTRNGDFEYARMLVLAYVPCMAETVKNYVYDTCAQNAKENVDQYKYDKLCSCASQSMRNFVFEKGQNYIPGFNRDSFEKSKSVANPLGHMLTRKDYQSKYNNELMFAA